MMTANIDKIISGCGTAFFIMMICGLILFAVKKNKNILWRGTAAAAVLFMILWRSIVPGFYSSRYALSLIVPAALFAGYFLSRFKKSYWVLLAALLIGFSCKNFRFDDGGKVLINASNAISAEVSPEEEAVILVQGLDAKRIELYSGLPALKLNFYEALSAIPRDTLRDLLTNQNASKIFVCGKAMANKRINQAELALPGKWELIYTELYNRKRRFEYQVYCYTPEKQTAVSRTGINIIENGDFETVSEISAGQQKIFTEKKLDYFLQNKPLLPANWIIDSDRILNNCRARLAEGENAISGKYSLLLDAGIYPCSAYSSTAFSADQPLQFHCTLSGSYTAEAAFSIRCRNDNDAADEKRLFITAVKIVRAADKTVCSFVFDPVRHGAQGKQCRLEISAVNGKIFIDNVSAVKIKP